MKRTPAVEASIVYAIALVLSFVGFLLSSNLTDAVNRSQWVAVLLLMPAWGFMAILAWILRKRNRYVQFFGAVSVISAIAVTGLALVSMIGTHGLDAAQTAVRVASKNNLYLAVLNFYVATLLSAAGTHFWIFRNRDDKPNYAPVNPSLVKKSARKKKK
jgi:hypothetical protein